MSSDYIAMPIPLDMGYKIETGVSTLINDGFDGHGQTVSIVAPIGQMDWVQPDIETFKACAKSTATISFAPGTPAYYSNHLFSSNYSDTANITSGAGVEDMSDIETVMAIAPKANIEIYEPQSQTTGFSTLDAITQWVNQDNSKVMTSSWIMDECFGYDAFATNYQKYAQSMLSGYDTVLATAAVQGQTFVSSSVESSSAFMPEEDSINQVVPMPSVMVLPVEVVRHPLALWSLLQLRSRGVDNIDM